MMMIIIHELLTSGGQRAGQRCGRCLGGTLSDHDWSRRGSTVTSTGSTRRPSAVPRAGASRISVGTCPVQRRRRTGNGNSFDDVIA